MSERKFNEYLRAEEGVLRKRLEAIRLTIPNANRAEKGRSVELEVTRLLRDMLPAEYGLSTGFIAYHPNGCVVECQTEQGLPGYIYDYSKDTVLVSAQIDLIIYDALRFGPIARLGGCDILPLEAVYAYVEVKSWVDNRAGEGDLTALDRIMQQSYLLRSLTSKLYWVSVPGTYTKTVLVAYPRPEVIPMRSLVFVLEADDDLGDAEDLRIKLQEAARRHRGHISAMYIQGRGFYRSVHGEKGAQIAPGSFDPVVPADRALSHFRSQLYSSLSRYPRPQPGWTAAIDRYFDSSPIVSAPVVEVQRPPAPGVADSPTAD